MKTKKASLLLVVLTCMSMEVLAQSGKVMRLEGVREGREDEKGVPTYSFKYDEAGNVTITKERDGEMISIENVQFDAQEPLQHEVTRSGPLGGDVSQDTLPGWVRKNDVHGRKIELIEYEPSTVFKIGKNNRYTYEYNAKDVLVHRRMYVPSSGKRWRNGKIVDDDPWRLVATDSCDSRGNIVMHYDEEEGDTIRCFYDNRNRVTRIEYYKYDDLVEFISGVFVKTGKRSILYHARNYSYDDRGNLIRVDFYGSTVWGHGGFIWDDLLYWTEALTITYDKSCSVENVQGLQAFLNYRTKSDWSELRKRLWEPRVEFFPKFHSAPLEIKTISEQLYGVRLNIKFLYSVLKEADPIAISEFEGLGE